MAAPDDEKLDLIARLQQLPMRHRWLRWAVLAGSLAFSAASTVYFSLQGRQEAHSRIETAAVRGARDGQSRVRVLPYLEAAVGRAGGGKREAPREHGPAQPP